MNQAAEKILRGLGGKKVGAFVDDSNLYHAYQKYGWRVDFGKFKKFLENFCNLQFIHYHVAVPEKADDTYKGTEIFLGKIKPHVIIRQKWLKYTPVAGRFIKKGDTDVEIVLDVVRTIDNLDVIIILSGDSDFHELKNYVIKDKSKNIIFWAFEKNMAWELKYSWHLYLDDFQRDFLQKYSIAKYKFA